MNELNIRDPEDYPENLKFTLDLITINETPKVVGSTAYLVHKYPSDVDVFEMVTVRMNRKSAVKFYALQLKVIAQKIKINKTIFFDDFKAGEDYRFSFDITNSTEDSRKEFADKLYYDKLLTKDEYDNLISNISTHNIYKIILRSFRVLRWTLDEIIRGYKKVRGNMELTLEKAINQNALVKLDVITWLVNRYVSIEVFFDLRYIETNTVVELFMRSSYMEQLLRDIEIYTYEHYNPLKVSKRMWALSRITSCGNIMKAINPLLGSNAAALNQVVADIDTLNSLLKNKFNNVYTKLEYDRMIIQILGFQKRIENHALDNDSLDKDIQKIYNIWNDMNNQKIYPRLIDNTKNSLLTRGIEIRNIEIRGVSMRSDHANKHNMIIDVLNDIRMVLMPLITNYSDNYLNKLKEQNITCTNNQFEIRI